MQLTTERDAFLGAITVAKRFADKRPTIPILAHARLQAMDGRLRITATDLDRTSIVDIPAAVMAEGAITVPAHLLGDYLKNAPKGGSVAMEVSGDEGDEESIRLDVAIGRSKTRLKTLPASEFPIHAFGKSATIFMIGADVLTSALRRVEFAISTEETRYYLNGVVMHTLNNQLGRKVLRFEATDGHRLAIADVPVPSGALGLDKGVILPRLMVDDLIKLLKGAGEVIVEVDAGGSVRITSSAGVIVSKTIDGTFPDTQRVIPTQFEHQVTVNRKELIAVVKRVTTMATERGRAVKLELSEDGRGLTASVHNPDSGSMSEEMPCAGSPGPFTIGFNAGYLLDILGTVEANDVKLRFQDSGSPMRVDDHASMALFVLMPLRVRACR